MRFLEDNEIAEWAREHGLRTGDRFRVEMPAMSALLRTEFAVTRHTGLEPAAAAALVDRLGAWTECLLWINGVGVIPSGEDGPAFYAWRARFGERRSLDTSPGHLFVPGERASLQELVQLVMENWWDAVLLCSVGGRVDRIGARISHDGWFEVTTAPAS